MTPGVRLLTRRISTAYRISKGCSLRAAKDSREAEESTVSEEEWVEGCEQALSVGFPIPEAATTERSCHRAVRED